MTTLVGYETEKAPMISLIGRSAFPIGINLAPSSWHSRRRRDANRLCLGEE